ncbi:MAG: cadherin-like beta sandwich domain-containing protein [Proteobacteria bacterium]|nr:cadherin-like beta sandwich domain-containing protein [Pseudomonadota bacterium]
MRFLSQSLLRAGRSILACLALLTALCLSAAAQTPYTIALDPAPASITIGSTASFRATVRDSGGNLAPGVTVLFNVRGKTVTFSATQAADGTGVATLAWNFSPPGDYDPTTNVTAAVWLGYIASNIEASPTINLVAGNSLPGPPTGVSASVINAPTAQVDVFFTPPGYTGTPAATDYTVTASPGGASATCPGSPCRVSGLTFGTTYTFTARANNTAGAGPESAPSASVTPLSGNNNLSALSASAGTLSPAFSPATNVYSISVANAVSSIDLFATPDDANATLLLGGSPVAPGAPMTRSLNVGINNMFFSVRAANSTLRNYQVSVTRAPSSDATLASLTLSTGALSPAFSAGVTSYTVNVPNATASLSLTPVSASPTASIRVNGASVASGATVPASLVVGANTVAVQVTAQDGTTIQTYTVTINRAPSSNATLASLSLSTGTLSPGFSAGVTDYTVNLPFGATALSLTPSVSDPTATLQVNGAPATSGSVAGPFPLALGANTITIQVTAQDGTTRTTYRVVATRAQAIGALVLSASTGSAFQGASITLTATYTGPVAATGTVTFFNGGSSLATLPLSGNRAELTLSSLPAGNLSLTARYNGDASNQAVTSSPISVLINARPNPASDPSVKAMVSAQMASAMRFGQAQIDGIANRLEQLHDQGENATQDGPMAAERGGGGTPTGMTGPLSRFEGVARVDDPLPQSASRQGSDLGRGLQQMAMMLPSLAQAVNKRANLPFEIWTGTALSVGRARQDGSYNQRFNNAHLVIGADRRFSPDLRIGFAVSVTIDNLDIGRDGSRIRGSAPSFALYASWRMMPQTYLDVLGGFGTMRLQSRRYSTVGGVMLDGTRTGRDVFGSLALTRRFTAGNWNAALFTRFDMVTAWLDGYAERGDPLWTIRYGATTSTSYAAVLGGRIGYDIRLDWGTLSPTLRLEYRRNFQGSYNQDVGYTDGASSGVIVGAGTMRSQFSAGLGLRARLENDLAFELGYLLSGSSRGINGQRFSGAMRYNF